MRAERSIERWAIGVVASVGLGCASLSGPTLRGAAGKAAEGAAEQGVPTALERALETLNTPESQEKIANLLALPALRDTARDLAGAALEGGLQALSETDRASALGDVSDALAASLARSFGRELEPLVRRLTSVAVDHALREASSGPAAERLARFTGALGAELANGLVAGLRTELGPAMRAVIREEIGPAMREMLVHEVEAAFGETLGGREGALSGVVRSSVREAVLSTDDTLSELARAPNPGPLGQLGSAARQGGRWLSWVFGLSLAGALLLGALLYRTTRSLRRDRQQARRREAAMLLLVDAMRGERDAQWSAELDERLRTQLAGREGAAELRELLNRPEPPRH
jgi:hypothetical protein